MKKSCSGFTLIELLVSISIIGILFTIGFARYNEFNRRQILVQAAQELKSNLRLAQSKTLAAQKDETACGSGSTAVSLKGWYVDFTAKQIYGKCGDTSFGTSFFEISNEISLVSSESPLRFIPLTGGVDVKTGPEAIICISGFDKEYQIRVTPSGEIKDDGLRTCQVVPANVNGLTYVTFDGSWPGELTEGVSVQAYFGGILQAETYSGGGGNYTLQGLEPNKPYYLKATYVRNSVKYSDGALVTTGNPGTTVNQNFYLF